MHVPTNSTDSAHDKTTGFLRLLGLHERNLVTFILALVPSWADAEDIAQEVRIRLWEQYDQYDASKDFGAWARAIAYWEVLTWRKKAQRSPAWVDVEVMDLVAKAAEEYPPVGSERFIALQDCIEKLDPAHRRLVELYYSGRKSARQLAEELHRSFHAVRHTLQRSRLALAKCISRSVGEEEP